MDVVKEVQSLQLGDVATVVSSLKRIGDATTSVIDTLVNVQCYTGLYVTFNRPYRSLCEHLKRNKIDPNSLFFIDMVTLKVSGQAVVAPNCFYVDSPQELMTIAATLTRVVQEHPMVRFLVLDSLSTMALYNDTATIHRFIHFMTSALRELRMQGIFVTPQDDTAPQLIDFLHCFSDRIVYDTVGEVREGESRDGSKRVAPGGLL